MKPTFLLVALCLTIFSLFSCGEGEDACIENDCGGYGECVDDEGVATCICDDGFSEKVAGTCSELCAQGACTQNGTCEHDGQSDFCVCDVVYTASGLQCVESCSLVDCGEGGTCLLEDGEAVCDCYPGFFTAPGAPLTCIWTDAQRCADFVEVAWECYEEICAGRGLGSPFCECLSRTSDINQNTCGCFETDFDSNLRPFCSLLDFEVFIPQTDYNCEAAGDAVLGICQ